MTDTQNGPISENGNKLINAQIFFDGNLLKTIGDYVINGNLAKTLQAKVREFGSKLEFNLYYFVRFQTVCK